MSSCDRPTVPASTKCVTCGHAGFMHSLGLNPDGACQSGRLAPPEHSTALPCACTKFVPVGGWPQELPRKPYSKPTLTRVAPDDPRVETFLREPKPKGKP